MEARYQPANPWTRDEDGAGHAIEAMLRAIVGFEVPIAAIRGTRKFNQHKSAADVDATIAGLRAAGLDEVAERRERTADVNRLALFDCDGTLVDSGATIHRALADSFARNGLVCPPPAEARRVIGLSLVEAMAALLPRHGPDDHSRHGRGV